MAYDYGFKEEQIKLAIDMDVAHINDFSYKEGSNLTQSSFIMRKMLDYDMNYFNYYQSVTYGGPYEDMELIYYALSKGYKPTKRVYDRNRYNDEFILRLIDSDLSNIERYKLSIPWFFCDTYKLIVDNGFVPSDETIKFFEDRPNSSIITRSLVEKKPHILKYYKGNDDDIISFALEKGYLSIDNIIEKITPYMLFEHIRKNNDKSILEKFKDNDRFGLLTYIFSKDNFDYTISGLDFELLDKYIYGVDAELFGSNQKVIIELLKNSDSYDCFEYLLQNNYGYGIVYDYILENKLDEKSAELVRFLGNYRYDKKLFITREEDFYNFLSKCGIDKNAFIQYGLNNSFDYLKTITEIIDSGKTEEFLEIKNYLFSKFYTNNSNLFTIKNFINILRSYENYPGLLRDIVEKQNIPEEYLDDLQELFNGNCLLDENFIPNSIDDLDSIRQKIKYTFGKKLINLKNDYSNVRDLKNDICITMFGMNLYSIEDFLDIYGGRQGLRQLLFENKNNKKIVEEILVIMNFISIIESVVYLDDIEKMYELAQKIYENFEIVLDCKVYYDGLEERLRQLYEHELNANLTNVESVSNIDGILDKKKSEEYGIDTIDFSDKKYCLLFHVMSQRETPDELINGITSPNKNTLCTSVGSNRNLVLYYGGKNSIIFVTDEIPSDVFIRSSDANMGSNGSVEGNTYEDKANKVFRSQHGALATSIAPRGYNSEVFTFREGVKFKYIALPGGRTPTSEELEVAKKFGLKFIITQELSTTIPNPKNISKEQSNSRESKQKNSINIPIEDLKDKIIPQNNGPRKIAIFGDAHGLFEPTLAILEDARKQGITEIYSLGDNIGTGPNPSEVMELLDEYGVQSIKGNHEGYAIDGIEQYLKHLEETGAVEEAKRNIEYVRSMLTEEQLKQIQELPTERQIKIGEQLLYLTHYTQDYNTGEKINIPEEVDQIIQGHKHFKNFNGPDDKIITVRGAGIGYTPSSFEQTAYYLVLTENPDGTYSIEEKEVQYSGKTLYHEINESSLDPKDKEKITGWAGVSR